MRIAIYCRTSTNRQENEQTIESQLWALRNRVKEEQNWTLFKEYPDSGWGGDILARPALDQLRDDAKQKLFDAILVVDYDRIARRFAYQAIVLDELEELEIQVLSLNQVRAETAEDKVLLGFKGLFAEYERVKIAERTRRGKLRKASAGTFFGWNAPYGYQYVSDPEPHFEILEEEAEVVRKIFKWLADGSTIRGVIRKLADLKIKPKKNKRPIWVSSTISRLVRNEVYIGIEYYNKNYAVVPQNPKLNGKYKKVKKSSRKMRNKEEWFPIKVSAILNEELFYLVQDRLKENKIFAKRNRKREYLLAGKIYCGCGRKRLGEGIQDHIYYRCSDRIYNFPLPQQCFIKGVNAAILDNIVWENVVKLLSNADLIKKQAEKYLDKQTETKTTSQGDIEAVSKKISKLKDQEARFLKAYGAGLMTLEQLKTEKDSIKSSTSSLQQELEKTLVKEPTTSFDLSNVDKLVEEVKEVVKSFNFEQKQGLIRNLLDTVVVENQTKVLVKGFIPLDNQVGKVGLCAESRNCRTSKCG